MQPSSLSKVNASIHGDIVRRTLQAIDGLRACGGKVSFYSVAERAQVARSTLYRCDDLRRLVEEARANSGASDSTSMVDTSRVDELEKKLAEVTAERDALASAERNIGPALYYTFFDITEAA